MEPEIFGEIGDIELIAAGSGIRELTRLQEAYGQGRWRKLKGRALARLPDERVVLAEVHWYEAHGHGRKELKIKRILD